jgi:outer membrane immunogenic protein
MMIRLGAVTTIVLVGLSTGAVAADFGSRFATPSPTPFPASAMNWTGMYLGLNAGAGFGGDFEARTTLLGVPVKADLSAGGFTGGGQAGVNFQLSPGQGIVVGVEGDFNYAAIKNRISIGADVPGGPSVIASVEAKADYLATIRGRFGYAYHNMLVYVTGGAAFTKVKLAADANLGGFLGVGTVGTSDSKTHVGWVAGAGLEAALNRNVSLKAEYLYAGFGRQTYFAQYAVPGVFPGIRVELNQHIIRSGINYRF